MSDERLSMVFITDGEPFHGGSPEEQALGGSETALIQVARALAALGHRVEVFCRCPRPGTYERVLYRDRLDLVAQLPGRSFDVAIISRFYKALDLPIQAGLKVLWNHDILDRPEQLASRLGRVDLMFVLSRFHSQDYLKALPECSSKLTLTRNGLDLDLAARASQGIDKVPGRYTYVSRPERGLRLLLADIWPRVREDQPDARLLLCGYQVGDTPLSARLQREYAEIEAVINADDSVTSLGSLAKEDYYRHLASCEALLYPCVFPEISCIAALEAQALGTPVVTSDGFALSETVTVPRFRVGGEPGSPAYVDEFVERVRRLHAEPEETRLLASQAKAAVLAEHGWSVIAREWVAKFMECLEERISHEPVSTAASLVLGGSAVAAAELLGREPVLPDEGSAPPDPAEGQLALEIKQMLEDALTPYDEPPLVGVLEAQKGRGVASLASAWPEAQVEAVTDVAEAHARYDAMLLRDCLERDGDPAALLAGAASACKEGGYLLLCVAAGAWPLKHPGQLARRQDLSEDDLAEMLPGRDLTIRFLPRGLVTEGDESYFLGRRLALAPARGPEPRNPDPRRALRRARPAPPRILEEVLSAGIL